MAERRENFERCWRILEYLRWNTDSEHPVSHVEMQKDSLLGPYLNDLDTLKSCVFNMAQAMNRSGEDWPLPPDRWKVIYEAFSKRYGGRGELEETEDEEAPRKAEKTEKRLPIRELYYQHTFSYEEINALIEGVLFSRTLSTKEANQLVKKIEENLTTKFYKVGPKNICTVRETVLTDRDRLRENLLLIQRAIDDGVQIAFRFNGYNHRKQLQPVRESKDIVSPYYIVANGGRYYLLACSNGRSNMSIWRVDLMTEMEIPGLSDNCKGVKAADKRDVENLPQVWDEKFPLRHLNMAYDQPILITLRVYKSERLGRDFTFLYDWFGDTFHFEYTETEPPYGDIVQVVCSPFSMVNWALQYSDRVEVLEPEKVRHKVAEKIRILKERYIREE